MDVRSGQAWSVPIVKIVWICRKVTYLQEDTIKFYIKYFFSFVYKNSLSLIVLNELSVDGKG